ncbi:transcriptional regulator with XRE-family HTH domain [Dysgonomonas sp. PH5-45]|uniref:helix-turn-helix domain-containing protein n=1 Tax=unclassified Dysgonomonas TaxID=2630389 RepID=UPI002476E78E|nr:MULTISPECIES: helix-turn-helix transcriptional regulator [unclassified Dysgonomonas]MDH6353951.1 transcriptional regulator with XRE-family HTH domain [Dysgonomonas sp. PH5-45]MDH6386853.1 transcriptional regulator with XRE-family HTH domain [Dysgonomonas sp. PH5-37]
MIAERIKKIMETEELTPARFADNLSIGRAVISHILNGRNKPSLDVITRILKKMPQINSTWLLMGEGAMYLNGGEDNEQPEDAKNQNGGLPDLFSQNLPSENQKYRDNLHAESKNDKENILNSAINNDKQTLNERIIYKEAPVKKIKQIIIYYTDNTFETFNA